MLTVRTEKYSLIFSGPSVPLSIIRKLNVEENKKNLRIPLDCKVCNMIT